MEKLEDALLSIGLMCFLPCLAVIIYNLFERSSSDE